MGEKLILMMKCVTRRFTSSPPPCVLKEHARRLFAISLKMPRRRAESARMRFATLRFILPGRSREMISVKS